MIRQYHTTRLSFNYYIRLKTKPYPKHCITADFLSVSVY